MAIFSIITINYNNLRGLKNTLASVWNQTARNQVEFVVIDGNSNDGSAEFLTANKDKIDVLIIEKDTGIYNAMNKGLKNCSGNFTWFINSGDSLYNSQIIEKIIPLIQKNTEIIYGDTMFVNVDGKETGLVSKLKPMQYPKKLTYKLFQFGMPICHQSVLVSKKIAPNYSEHFKIASDILWCIESLKNANNIINSNLILTHFEDGGASTVQRKLALKERYTILKNEFGFFNNLFAHCWIFLRGFLFKLNLYKP